MSDTDTSTTAPATPDSDEHPAVTALKQTLGEIELGVLTSYTLADAIREGASVTGQKRQGYVDPKNSCGLGAAFIAVKARGFLG